ncbi:MAG TPA: SDR family oxidoreductase, partial [Pseudomonadales bacterium]|nr:SDR family oxidoreductase [Pseudomonadales bacterium]
VETPVHEAAILASMASDGISRAEAERRTLSGKQPTGRFISPEGVASLVLFLCGPASADITGAVLPVDGGWSAG